MTWGSQPRKGAGNARGIQSTAKDGSGNLIITYTDGTTQNVGKVEGLPGKVVASNTVDANGHLIVTYTDNTTADLGLVKPAATAFRSGAGAPADTLGADGDQYLNTATGDVHTRAGGTYTITGNIKGTTGANPLLAAAAGTWTGGGNNTFVRRIPGTTTVVPYDATIKDDTRPVYWRDNIGNFWAPGGLVPGVFPSGSVGFTVAPAPLTTTTAQNWAAYDPTGIIPVTSDSAAWRVYQNLGVIESTGSLRFKDGPILTQPDGVGLRERFTGQTSSVSPGTAVPLTFAHDMWAPGDGTAPVLSFVTDNSAPNLMYMRHAVATSARRAVPLKQYGQFLSGGVAALMAMDVTAGREFRLILRASGHGAMTLTTGPGANAGASSITINAATNYLPAGKTFTMGGVSVTTTADLLPGATTLSVQNLPGAITAGASVALASNETGIVAQYVQSTKSLNLYTYLNGQVSGQFGSVNLGITLANFIQYWMEFVIYDNHAYARFYLGTDARPAIWHVNGLQLPAYAVNTPGYAAVGESGGSTVLRVYEVDVTPSVYGDPRVA